MPDRPSHLWRDMPLEKRIAAAGAFWRDRESPDIAVQHAEAVGHVQLRPDAKTHRQHKRYGDATGRHPAAVPGNPGEILLADPRQRKQREVRGQQQPNDGNVIKNSGDADGKP